VCHLFRLVATLQVLEGSISALGFVGLRGRDAATQPSLRFGPGARPPRPARQGKPPRGRDPL